MTFDWCRHCGADTEMTDEHLPPRATGNSVPGTLYNEQEGALVVVRSYGDGHTIPSLCKSCNTGASIRGLPQAYQAWRDDVVSNLELAAATYEDKTGGARADLWRLRMRDGGAFAIPIEHGRDTFMKTMTNLHPGRIARQVLGMTLAVQATRSLLDHNPQLKAAYYSDEAASIEPFSLHVALANAGINYFSDGVLSLQIAIETGRSTGIDFWMISFPPFLICLVDGPVAPIEATPIHQWLAHPVNTFFGRQDRNVAYPIANQAHPLVAKMYANGGPED